MGALHTERLDLTLMTPEHARGIATGDNPDRHARVAGYPTTSTLLRAELTIAAATQRCPLGAFGTYQVTRREDGRVIGDVGFLGPPDATGAVSIGGAIAPEERRRGYATEAFKALVEWAQEQPGVTCVIADTTRANVAAQRLLERAGLRLMGEDGELRYYMA